MSTTHAEHMAHLDAEQVAGDLLELAGPNLPLEPPDDPDLDETYPPDLPQPEGEPAVGMFSSKGPDERRAEGAQQRQHDRDRKALRAGDEKATRINDRLNDRRAAARREGR